MQKLVVTMGCLLMAVFLAAIACRVEATPTPPPATPSPRPAITAAAAKATAVVTPPPKATAAPAKPTAKPTTPAAEPKEGAKTLSLTTWSAGTTSYVGGLAMGTVLSKYANIKLAVEPLAAPLQGYARMAKGEVEMVFAGAVNTYPAYTGTMGSPKYEKVRDLFFTYASNYSIITRGDTGIKSATDLKGKKVSAIFPAAPVVEATLRVLLKEYGMDFDKDIVALRHSTILEMYENLKERRVDTAFGTGLRIKLEELARVPGGAHVVAVPRDKVLAVQKQFPFYFPENTPSQPARFPGTTPETITLMFGLGVTTSADVPDDLIYTIVKTVMDHLDEIRPAHAELSDFTAANFAKYPTIPFHNGAIKYYKEKGLWTTALETFQKNILEKGK